MKIRKLRNVWTIFVFFIQQTKFVAGAQIDAAAQPSTVIKCLHNGHAADTNRFDFVVAILLQVPGGWAFHCGGSIIGPHTVITAAHCLYDLRRMVLPQPRMLAIVAGDNHWEGKSNKAIIARVSEIYAHENYQTVSSEPDLAILILKKDLPIGGGVVGSIDLATEPPKDGELCMALGWGLNEKFHISSTLMAATFQIQPIEACILFFGVPSPKYICGMSKGASSSVCTGDSGGPLVCNGKLAGIIDASSINCSSLRPSLFTGVVDYVEWIKRKRTTSSACGPPVGEMYKYFIIVIVGQFPIIFCN